MDDAVEVTDIELRKPVACPWCKREHDTALGLTGAEWPSPGDVFLCINCGKFALWYGANELRKPTWDEFCEAMQMPEVILAWLAWKSTRQEERDQRRG